MLMFSTREGEKLCSQPFITAEDVSTQSKWQYNEWCVAYFFVCDANHFLRLHFSVR